MFYYGVSKYPLMIWTQFFFQTNMSFSFAIIYFQDCTQLQNVQFFVCLTRKSARVIFLVSRSKNPPSVMKAKAIGCLETRKGDSMGFPCFSHVAPLRRHTSRSFQQLNTWILCTSCNVTLKTWRMGAVRWLMYAASISLKKRTVK